ncbi:partial [Paramuricea clavata]|uniref:Partial n=1 Tax=Paramuricea clavata TaxID=317549 RepID=A0A7D9I5N5_PARCT|nr:partial [Paramuricea clavata]
MPAVSALLRFGKYKKILCKADKAKGISKPVPVHRVTEAKICPQKANDRCKANPCPAKMTTCKNTAKSYECIDVNECSKKGLCKSPEFCVNKKKTGYECRCPKELVRDKASKKCIVPDPCKSKESPCPSTSKCETIRSSSGTSHRCVDIDECLTGKYKCGDGEECYNKENGYECRCAKGFTREKGKCIAEIDPCKADPPVCDIKTQRCVSANRTSYECLDIDECSTQKHDCDKNAKCINTEPGFKCQCIPGFKEYDNGRTCKDLNECSNKFLCAKHAKCTNLPGSYKCQCNLGYSGDGKYCKDINECSKKKFKCPAHSKCHNTPGSYSCKCRHGFKLKNGRCLDVDECKVNSHNCHKNALCINSVGSFKCRCKKGFEHLKDGRLCLKDEETSKSNNTLIIIVAVSASLLLVILISCCLYWQRRNKKCKKNDSEEFKTLLADQVAQD